jgi:hypothetical protein
LKIQNVGGWLNREKREIRAETLPRPPGGPVVISPRHRGNRVSVTAGHHPHHSRPARTTSYVAGGFSGFGDTARDTAAAVPLCASDRNGLPMSFPAWTFVGAVRAGWTVRDGGHPTPGRVPRGPASTRMRAREGASVCGWLAWESAPSSARNLSQLGKDWPTAGVCIG